VIRKDEFSLFSRIMLEESAATFDSNKMSMRWIDDIDGVDIFPKLPSQLREYHKRWERNRRIQDALEKMKDDSALLERFMNEQAPPDDNTNILEIAGDVDEMDNQLGCHGYAQDVMPPAAVQVFPQNMLRPSGMGHLLVGLTPIGTGFFVPNQNMYQQSVRTANVNRVVPPRGRDKKQRQPRRCLACFSSGNPVREQSAASCKGRAGKQNCPHVRRMIEQEMQLNQQPGGEYEALGDGRALETLAGVALLAQVQQQEQTQMEDDEETYCASYPDGCTFGNGICSSTTPHHCTRCSIPIHCILCVPEERHEQAEDGQFWCYYCHHNIPRK
jgi:hypothetical protein